MNHKKIFLFMTIMQYNQFRKIFNETIFEKSKADLLEKIAKNPSRYDIQSEISNSNQRWETLAHLAGTQYIVPHVSFILDVGGQDNRQVIKVDGGHAI